MLPDRPLMFFLIFISLFVNACNDVDDDYGGKVFAKVNEIKITEKLVENRFKILGRDKERFMFLNDVIIPNYILYDEAIKKNLEASNSEVDEAIDFFASTNSMTTSHFRRKVDDYGISSYALNNIFREQVLISKLLDSVIVVDQVDEKDVLAFYINNKKDMVVNGEIQEFEDVRNEIRSMLIDVQKNIKIRNYVESLAAKGSVELFIN